jgi:preprotein translocase subunit SecA
MYDKILERFGLTYEDLTADEKSTMEGWMRAIESKKVTVETIKGFIQAMMLQVMDKLTKTDLNSKEDLFLKARLRNYMLLDAYLTSPEKAKEAMDRMLEGIVPKK